MAVFVRAGKRPDRRLGERSFYRPPKRMNRAKDEHRRLLIPSCIAQRFSSVFRPSGSKVQAVSVPSSLEIPKSAQHRLRFGIARDDEGFSAISTAHFLEHGVHDARFGAIANRQFILGGGDAERADHHGSQGVREFAFEHRAFGGDHAVIFRHFARKERGEEHRQLHLLLHHRNSRE